MWVRYLGGREAVEGKGRGSGSATVQGWCNDVESCLEREHKLAGDQPAI